MANQSRLKAIYQRIEDGIERESWQEARSGLRELARILVDATIVADNEFVAQIDELVAQIFLDVSLDDAFEAELSLNSIGWSADGLRDVSQLARKRRPPMTSEQRAATLKDAEARVLACLGEGNAGPKSNREIADKLDLHVATVARTLGVLRARGAVRSWPEGRFMMNMLAEKASDAPSQDVSNTRNDVEGSEIRANEDRSNIEKNDQPDIFIAPEFESKVYFAVKDEIFEKSPQKSNSFHLKKIKGKSFSVGYVPIRDAQQILPVASGDSLKLVTNTVKDNFVPNDDKIWLDRDSSELMRSSIS